MRHLQYFQEEFHYDPDPKEGSLLTFLYDIPYFPPCGVFPPFHLLNQLLLSGGSPGGMGPGATWEPFSITEDEYRALIEAVNTTPLSEIGPHARYAWLKPRFDPTLDHVEIYLVWTMAVCNKHRERWKEDLETLRRKKDSV